MAFDKFYQVISGAFISSSPLYYFIPIAQSAPNIYKHTCHAVTEYSIFNSSNFDQFKVLSFLVDN